MPFEFEALWVARSKYFLMNLVDAFRSRMAHPTILFPTCARNSLHMPFVQIKLLQVAIHNLYRGRILS